MTRAALVLAVLAASVAPAGAVVGGDPVTGDAPEVVAIVARGVATCSGVLIAPRVVVTAAHCVAPPEPMPDHVVFGDDVDDAHGRAIAIVRARIDPAFDRQRGLADIAVLELAAPSAALLPVRLADDGVRPDEQVEIIGFGGARQEPSPIAEPARKRRGTARATVIDADTIALVGDPAISCGGDSGAAVLAVRDGVRTLVGVIAHGDCKHRARATRVDRPLLAAYRVGAPAAWSALAVAAIALFGVLGVLRRGRRSRAAGSARARMT